MKDAHSVITQATENIVKPLAAEMEVTLTRMYEILGKDNPYPKTKRLIRKIARLNPDGARLIRADLFALFAEILTEDQVKVDGAELHREASEAVQSVLTNRPRSEQKRELRQMVMVGQKALEALGDD